jgi:hypothetical protein
MRHNLEHTTLRIVGRGITLTGRETVEVEANANSWDYPPIEPFAAGADDSLMSVDAEVGVALRLAFRLRGEVFDVFPGDLEYLRRSVPRGKRSRSTSRE